MNTDQCKSIGNCHVFCLVCVHLCSSVAINSLGPIVISSLALVSWSCAPAPINPSFAISQQDAASDLNRIVAAPRQLDRPLVIIGGFMDPGISPSAVGWEFEKLTADHRIIRVPVGTCLTFDDCRRQVIDAVNRACPSNDPLETVEVDAIGLSMGGVVARYAALPVGEGHPRRLRIARLFTVSSPLSGSQLAAHVPAILPLIAPLRAGSPMLKEINAAPTTYPVFSYVRLGDIPVGAANAAMPGRTAWWLSTPPMSDAHNGALWDPRILADIARRLRGESPLATEPPAPLPAKG